MKITQKKVTELIPYINNSRTHSDEQIAQIAASIKEFGWTNPILVDGDKSIIAGHGRLLAARKLGMDTVPTIELAHLTETQKKAYIIADNKLALNAGWDDQLLTIELNDLMADGFALELLGFDKDELDRLLEPEQIEGLTDEDAVPNVPDEPVTKLGDVWILGNHRLMCGDSTSIDAVDLLMEFNKADMVFTDPPYNMDFTGGIHADGSKSFNAKHGGIKNDKMSQIDAENFFDAINAIIYTYCVGAFYITFYRLGIGEYWKSLERTNLKVRSLIIWNKGNHTLSNSDYMSKYEPIFYGWTDNNHKFYGGNNGMDIWEIKRTAKNDLHPTMKPVELIEKALEDASKPGNLVLDLFGGSGSTMIAAEKTGRKSRLMELDPKYCDVIIKRWQDFTGKVATLEATGEAFHKVDKQVLLENAA
jgi:DNA modification methylase